MASSSLQAIASAAYGDAGPGEEVQPQILTWFPDEGEFDVPLIVRHLAAVLRSFLCRGRKEDS